MNYCVEKASRDILTEPSLSPILGATQPYLLTSSIVTETVEILNQTKVFNSSCHLIWLITISIAERMYAANKILRIMENWNFITELSTTLTPKVARATEEKFAWSCVTRNRKREPTFPLDSFSFLMRFLRNSWMTISWFLCSFHMIFLLWDIIWKYLPMKTLWNTLITTAVTEDIEILYVNDRCCISLGYYLWKLEYGFHIGFEKMSIELG